MRKTTLLTLAFSSLLILPAMAQLGKVWTDFQYYSVDLQNYLRGNVNETFRPLDIRTQGALSNSSGELNIPDPVTAGKQIRDDIIINSISGRYENNSAVNGVAVSNELNRIVTRGAVVSVLGRDGQVRLKTKLEDTERSIETITQTIEDADNLLGGIIDQVCKVTTGTGGVANVANASLCQSSIQQDTTVKILQEQAKINAENLAQTIQTNQTVQYTNLNLANISQQVEEANRARRVDSATEAARLLRTTSQIDLFGRENEN